MAVEPDRKKQNQAFLQAFEKQRLNKPCNRAIDLRGKVAGECQAYQFGDRVHYLDDRAYLLAKQLLARFDGRYTIGVYEALLQALKKIQPLETITAENNETSPELVKVDEALQRCEQRVLFTTPIRLQLDDVLYHGHTVDIAPSAIRVVLKRSYSLAPGDQVAVEFSDFFEQSSLPFLQKMPFEIIKLDHDVKNTTIVLSRAAGDDQAASQWLQTWVQQHISGRRLDIENEFINLVNRFYLRLWLKNLPAAIAWLGETNNIAPVIVFHRQQSAPILSPASLPLPEILSQAMTTLAVVVNGQTYATTADDNARIPQLLHWHLQHPGSRLLLLSPQPLHAQAANFSAELAAIAKVDKDHAVALKSGLARLQQRVMIHDISSLSQNIAPGAAIPAGQMQPMLATSVTQSGICSKRLSQYVERRHPRFLIRTPITVHLDGKKYVLETLDVSTDGLALKLHAAETVALNQQLKIDFTRWQTLTSKVDLQRVPYQVQTIQLQDAELRLGLRRISGSCPAALNRFFDWVIAKNQEMLKPEQADVIDAAEGRIFTSLLAPTLAGTALFFGMDDSGRNQVEVITATDLNQAATQDERLWLAIDSQVSKFSGLLRNLATNTDAQVNTTLYAYLNNHGDWTLALEEDFTDSRQKAIFMQRLLNAADYRVYHCVLMPLSNRSSEEEKDLMTQLLSWRQLPAHRVSKLKRQLSSLSGIADLTNVTDIIEALYRVEV